MKRIFLIGAGRSSTALIDYLLKHAPADDLEITVGDMDESLVLDKTKGHPNARPIVFNVSDEVQTAAEIKRADLIISLLPAHMHLAVAKTCVELGKSLVTASYITPEMKALHNEAVSRNVLLLNECGLDPGIDHMSAMQIIREINASGGVLEAFYSYTGGLVAPESNDNPWGYKFSWNPRNVILAGQGTAQLIENGLVKYIPYHRLFKQIVRIDVPNVGSFDGYANRDSLAYRKIYGIEGISTILRGTLRHEGYCSAWNVFVQLGLTDDSFQLDNPGDMTYADLVAALLPERRKNQSLREAVASLCQLEADSHEMNLVEWTGILSNQPLNMKRASPAQLLQQLLEEKWMLKDGDKDMVVMQHRFIYQSDNKRLERRSSLVVIGDDQIHTAMAKTVGLPVGIAARLILSERIKEYGVQLPVSAAMAQPILNELETLGIRFIEEVVELS